MSFNGSGTFVVNSAGQPVVANTVISATVFNALTADLATGLSTCITKDGQTTVTANIPFGNNKITALGAGTAASDAANLGQVQSTAAKLVTVTGTDTITGTMSPALTAYAAGQLFYFIANAANTGAVTINIDGLGAKSITRDGSTALAGGDINSGEVVVVVYDGTRFQMINAANSFGNTTINGTLTVTGNTALQANVSITSTLSVGGTFAVTGAATLGSTLAVTGKSDLPTVSTASINAAVALITTGTVTNLTASGASIASANIGNLQFTAASIASINAGVAVVTNLTATSASIASMNAGVALVTTATITGLTATGASVASANVGTAVVTGLTVTGASIASVNAGTATLSGNLTLNGGTANGVLYLDGSKVATSGSSLSFNGTTLTAPQMTLTSANGITMNSASGGLIDCSGNTLFIQFPSSNSLIFRQSGSPFTEYMRLNSTGLGIGTASPTYKLDVDRGASNGVVARFGRSSGQFAHIYADTASVYFGSDNGANTAWQFNESSDYLAAWTAGTERMRLDASGNLGIGTTSPAAKLDVAGTVRSNNALAFEMTGSASLRQTASGGAMYFDVGGGGSHGEFIWRSSSSFTTRMTLDSSGNLGLGVTPFGWGGNYKAFDSLYAGLASENIQQGETLLTNNAYNSATYASPAFKYKYTNGAAAYVQSINVHKWFTAPSGTAGNAITFTQAMTLNASGNLLIGTTSASGARIDVYESGSGNATVRIGNAQNGATLDLGKQGSSGYGATSAADAFIYNNGPISMMADSTGIIKFSAGGNTERARITAGGYFKASNDGTYVGSTANYHEFRSSNNTYAAYITNTNASPLGTVIEYTNASPNGTGNVFLFCGDSTATRATIRSNGGLANYQANNVDLSDARTKNSITPAASMWDKVAALEIVTYKYNDQTHDDVNLGVIAQQVESVEPVWVDADGFGETPEGEEPLKTVYTKDITFAAIKALQEAMARIEQLEAKVAQLEAR